MELCKLNPLLSILAPPIRLDRILLTCVGNMDGRTMLLKSMEEGLI